MRSFALFLIVSATGASAHSWVDESNGGTQRGGANGPNDFDLQRYFCPNGLSNCQEDSKNGIKNTEDSLKPCRAGQSPTWATASAGGDLRVHWVSKGHDKAESDGTCVKLYLAPFDKSDSMSNFQSLVSCAKFYIPQGNSNPKTETTTKLPSDLKSGKYTLLWLWDFAGFTFSSCVDMNVSGSGSSSSETPAPEAQTTVAPKESETTRAPEATTAAPEITEGATETSAAAGDSESETTTTPLPSGKKNSSSNYRKYGCAALEDPDDYCISKNKKSKGCKVEKLDSCGRAACHKDNLKNLKKCPNNLLRL